MYNSCFWNDKIVFILFSSIKVKFSAVLQSSMLLYKKSFIKVKDTVKKSTFMSWWWWWRWWWWWCWWCHGDLVTDMLLFHFNVLHVHWYSTGRSRNFRKGWPGHLPTCQLYRYMDFLFSKNSIKIMQNFKAKGVAAAPTAHSFICPCTLITRQ